MEKRYDLVVSFKRAFKMFGYGRNLEVTILLTSFSTITHISTSCSSQLVKKPAIHRGRGPSLKMDCDKWRTRRGLVHGELAALFCRRATNPSYADEVVSTSVFVLTSGGRSADKFLGLLQNFAIVSLPNTHPTNLDVGKQIECRCPHPSRPGRIR